MTSLFDSTVQMLIDLVNHIGYFGIFIGMFLESTLIPIPSELVMIPAGISAAQGGMNFYLALLAGVLGNVFGAVFSYYLAIWLGRPLLLKIGKYFFVKPETILKIEKFFKNHGSISVFTGRLIPGFRHFISLPAGIAKMDIKKFYLYTASGSLLWDLVLILLGYFIGANQELIKDYLHHIVLGVVLFCVILLSGYFYLKKSEK